MINGVFDWFRVVWVLRSYIYIVVCLDFGYVLFWVGQIVVIQIYWYQFYGYIIEVDWCWCFVVFYCKWYCYQVGIVVIIFYYYFEGVVFNWEDFFDCVIWVSV